MDQDQEPSAADQSFEQLVTAVQNGDEDAAAELMRLYEPEVRRMIRVRIQNAPLRTFLDSVDISQSVFANFFTRLALGQFELKSPQQLVQLLRVMASNRFVDWVRKERRRLSEQASGVTQPMLEQRVQSRYPNPADNAEECDLVERFRQYLTHDERHIADQRLAGKAWNEIAAELGETPDACRKRLSRASQRVAEQMKNE